jgi:hypothetical protein
MPGAPLSGLIVVGEMREPEFSVVLNSRQQLQPSRRLSWVQKTIEAVEFLRQTNAGLISSIGMPTWELLTSLGAINELPLRIIIPAETEERFAQLCVETVEQYRLNQSVVSFIRCENSSGIRDKIAIARADQIVPISIRPGGLLEELLTGARASGASVRPDFQTVFKQRTAPLAYSLEGVSLNPELYQLPDEYVVHWTRATNSPWPNETKLDHYRSILESDRYPRQAIDSLNRIISSGLITATAKNMPHSTRTVSFSDAAPHDVIKLIRWRSRQRLMSFEPYGVGLERELALKLGIKPVIYFDRHDEERNLKVDPWLWQSQGVITDWRAEQELRCLGDFDLRGIPNDQLILFCLTQEEARELRLRHRIRAVSFLP